MARHRRTLEEQLADAAGQSRATAGLSFSTPALAPITADHITPGAITPEKLDPALTERIETIDTVEADLALVDDKITDAISDYDAMPITWDKFSESELSIWPFVNTIPREAIGPGTITPIELADWAVTPTKIHDGRHRIY